MDDGEKKVTAGQLNLAIDKGGVRGGVELLYRNFAGPIERYACRCLGERDCIDPNCHKHVIKQDTFLAILKALRKYIYGTYKDIENPDGWVYTISKSKISDHFRLRQCRELPNSSLLYLDGGNFDLSDDGRFVSQTYSQQEDRGLIIGAKDSLKPIYQEALEDKYLGLTDLEIAQQRHIPKATVRWRRKKAIYLFAVALEERGIYIGGKNNE